MIIAFVSKKGGVGKTTTAVNLAAALTMMGKRVLVVDLDPQASSSLSLGVSRSDLAPSIVDVLRGELPIGDAVRATGVPRLSLITASTDLAMLDREMAPLRRPEELLSFRLDAVRPHYDFVFLDCPPSFSLMPTSALVASDAYVIPMTPHFLAVEGLGNLISGVERFSQRYGKAPKCLGILLTMVDYRTNLTRKTVSEIREQFTDRVFAIEVRVNIRVAEAPAYGLTIFQHDAKAPAAKAFDLLAQEFLLRSGQADTEPVAEAKHQANQQPTELADSEISRLSAAQSPPLVPFSAAQTPMRRIENGRLGASPSAGSSFSDSPSSRQSGHVRSSTGGRPPGDIVNGNGTSKPLDPNSAPPNLSQTVETGSATRSANEPTFAVGGQREGWGTSREFNPSRRSWVPGCAPTLVESN